jgi:hypothetical protein
MIDANRRPIGALHNAALAAALAVGVGACAASPAETCTRDDQCASRFCKADGTCAPAADASDRPDTAPGATPDAASGCAPDHDGTIARAELPLAAGQHATFRIATGATVDTAGALETDGSRRWTLAAALSGDGDHQVALESPAGAWWSSAFPTATYATILSSQNDLRGVFRVDDTGLHLLGIVSPAGGAGRTQLAYDPPVDVLRLPLTTTSAWTSSPSVTGMLNGIGGGYAESYDAKVDAIGTMTTPYGEFPVMRVAVDFTQTAAVITTHKTFAYVSECYGTVATITSESYETQHDFTKAAEVWRIAP